jgi:adenylate kinase family enzyme
MPMQSFFDEIQQSNKIIIGGNSASGKSTLAKIIAEKQRLPYYSFDKLYWGPGWSRPDQEQFKKDVLIICQQDTWVFEGGARLLEERCDAADCMIYMHVPTIVCLWRAFVRCFRLVILKKERDTLPKDCHPMINWYLIKTIIKFPWRKKVFEMMAGKVTPHKKLIVLNMRDLENIRQEYKMDPETSSG